MSTTLGLGFRLENQLFEDELKRIVALPHKLVFSVQYLNEAIARFKELKRACEVQAVSKGLIPVVNLESDDEGEVNNVSNGNRGPFHMDLDQIHPEPSVHGGVRVSTAQMIQSGHREKHVRYLHETPPITVGHEPRVKRRRIWSVDLHRRFLHAVNTLGGPLAATPKKIKDLMQVADITEDEIKSHLQKYRSAQSHKIIQSGSQQIPISIGESSNGQMAAAAANRTGGGWTLVTRAPDLFPSYPSHGTCSVVTQDMMMREKFIRSGSRQVSLHTGESSSRQMEAAANEANVGWKLISEPYVYANVPMNNFK